MELDEENQERVRDLRRAQETQGNMFELEPIKMSEVEALEAKGVKGKL